MGDLVDPPTPEIRLPEDTSERDARRERRQERERRENERIALLNRQRRLGALAQLSATSAPGLRL